MKIQELFRLIQSLDDRERRLFRRFSGQHKRLGKSNYLLIFDALAGMETCDEAALHRKLGDPELVRALPSYITRLFQQVLDFLRQINEFPSVESLLNAACERVALLVARGLNDSARRELQKAQKLAKEHDSHLHLLRLADLERSFFFKEGHRSIQAFKQALDLRDREFLHALQEETEIKLAHFEALFRVKTRVGIDEGLPPELQRLSGPNTMKTIRQARATSADIILLNAIGLTAQLEGDFDRAYAAYSRMDSLWVSNPTKIAEHAQIYIDFTSSFLNACLLTGRHKEFRSLLANIKTVRFENELHALSLREVTLYLELTFCLNRFEYDRGVALGPEIEEIIRRNRGRMSISRIMSFYFNIGSLHFLKGEYSKANRWLSLIINHPVQEYRKDVLAFLPVFQLVLFMAMNDRELLESRLRARMRQPRESVRPLESAILRLARSFLVGAAQFQDAILAFNEELEVIASTSSNEVGVGECLFWAQGRLKGKLPGEVLREYAQGHEK